VNKRLCLAALSIPVVLVAYAFLEPYWLMVREVHISHVDVPEAFDGTRIAFLTDIHHGPYFSLKRVTAAVSRANLLQPHIVLLGGDYVHRDAQFIRPCFAELSNLEPALGTFGVLGNHDHWEGAVLTSHSMIEAGIGWINNRSVWVAKDGQHIKIGGVDDLWEGSQNLEATTWDAHADDFVILVSHNPDYVEQMDTDKVDLVLSGHTHGGQVTFFGLWAPFVPSEFGQKYRSGVVQTGSTTVVISNGIGTIPPPLRFFARPEIVLVVLERA